MFIRWERSNVRENIAMSQFAFKNSVRALNGEHVSYCLCNGKGIIVLSNDVADALDRISLSINVLKLNTGRYLNIF